MKQSLPIIASPDRDSSGRFGGAPTLDGLNMIRMLRMMMMKMRDDEDDGGGDGDDGDDDDLGRRGWGLGVGKFRFGGWKRNFHRGSEMKNRIDF